MFYRITQFGAERLFPLMTKRKVSISLEELLFLARERQATFALIEEKFGKPLEEVPEGGKANHNYEGLATIVHKNVLFGYYVLYVKNPDPEEQNLWKSV